MKKLFYVFIFFALVSCGAQQTATISSDPPKISTVQSAVHVTAQSIIAQMDKGKYREGELLVKFKSGVVTTSSLKIHQGVGASVTKKFTVVPNLELVKLPQGLSIKDAILQYMADPNVEYAEPNYIRRGSVIPTDQYFGQQWALHNIGQFAGGTEDADIDAPEAWDISQGSSSIIVAVLDTGIDYNHPDLVNNIWINTLDPIQDPLTPVDDDGNGFADDYRGWDFTSCAHFNQSPPFNCITPKSPDNDPMDDNGHGTHVAGIIGAVGNNGVGIAGVMWNVKLMALKFLNADGGGTTADEIAGIQYAIAKSAKIINASFGGEEYSQAEYDAINTANAAGILFVAAAGNGGEDRIGDNNDLTPFYPASYNLPNIISVAATDQKDVRASFSNFGPTSVHVAAPGVYILSTVPTHIYPTGYLEFDMGTSMSAPHVSGIAGLLYSYYDGIQNTQFNLSQVRNTILRYGDPKPTLSVWIQTGKRVNAYLAVTSLLKPTNLSVTATSPTQISITWLDNATGEDGYKIERKIGSGSYTEIATLPANVSSFTDSSLTPETTYTYRVKVFNNIADSFPSDPASATTPAEPVVPTGGGGCSIGARQNTPTAVADFVVMLIPLLFVVVMKFRRRV